MSRTINEYKERVEGVNLTFPPKVVIAVVCIEYVIHFFSEAALLFKISVCLSGLCKCECLTLLFKIDMLCADRQMVE